MAEWGQLKRDLQEGVGVLSTQMVRLAQRTGREVVLLESRRELVRVERQLARLYQELGEVAYDAWSRPGGINPTEPELRARLESIAGLITARDERKKELADFEQSLESQVGQGHGTHG